MALLSMSSPWLNVDRAPAQCLEGHRLESCLSHARDMPITLVSPSLKFTIFHSFSRIILCTCALWKVNCEWNKTKEEDKYCYVLKQYVQVNTVIALLAFTGKTKGIC